MIISQNIERTQEKNATSRTIKNLLQKKWLSVILALILTGLGAAITGVLFKAGVQTLGNWRLSLLNEYPVWLILPALGALGGLLSGTLIKQFSPAASGSGVTHIISYLRHHSVPMGLKVGLTKLFAGIIAIGSGFPLGPEGPSVQMGGSIAWQTAQWLKAPKAFRRVIVAAGGGAGIAAIFSAPIGGFIYAIEELLNSARPVVLVLVVVTTFWADTFADVLQSFGLDMKAGGFDHLKGFQIERTFNYDAQFLPIDLVYLIGLGVIIGILAELYCRYVLTMQRQGKLLFGDKLITKMVICGTFLGIIYSCLPEKFHEVSKLQYEIVSGNVNIYFAISTFLIIFISTGLAAASGAPGGLFYPMLTLGGSIGLACDGVIDALTGYVPNTYVFAGMGAFVAACSHTPITAMFLAFALTKNLLILKPILISCLTSFLVARSFNEESIYERQIKLELNEKNIITSKSQLRRNILNSFRRTISKRSLIINPSKKPKH